MKRLALWLAEFTDRWARTAAHDDLTHWEVDRGTLIDTYCRVIYLDEYTLARRRHPAGRALR